MRIFIKRSVAVADCEEPARLLREIEETKKIIQELEKQQEYWGSRANRASSERDWFRKQSAAGELKLKDVPQIDYFAQEAQAFEKQLAEITKKLETTKEILTKQIATFNCEYVGVEGIEEIK